MQRQADILNASVRYFKGVGPKRCDLLAKLGIRTIEDILYYLPSRYEDRSKFSPIKDLKIGERQTIRGRVLALSTRRTKSGMSLFEMAIGDETGHILAVWFNQPFLRRFFKVGQEIIAYGKVETYQTLQISQPEYEILKEGEEDSIHIGRIVPIYPLTSQVTQRYLRALAYMAVTKYARFARENLPTHLRAVQKLADIRFAMNNIHFPTSFENLQRAYRRIVFEEFFLLQLALAMRKREAKESLNGISHRTEGDLIRAFMGNMPFELTKGQKDAIRDIERDMAAQRPMNRLLEGDVGSGKTVVAAYALILTVQNGLQGAFMAPTEVLAGQHYRTLSRLLLPLGVNIAFLSSALDRAAKEKVLEEVKDGMVDLVVGTHALIEEAVEFKALGLAVIDEQHKFGVAQRALLRQKGRSPHVLVMTATPIPRTLALTVYGDLDISVIRELPKGRQPIATYWVEEAKRERIYSFIEEELAKGRQAYIVYPRIEESEERGMRSARRMYETLAKGHFRTYRLGLLHGKMGSKDKDGVMADFKNGEIDILVATVVIEVGIDVPNASVMLIENAERFGLAQLHQLRGRIGRGDYESYCILLADPKTENAKARLKAIEETVDGFEIAEEDLDLRGPGEFFGTSQHGLPEIRFGNIIKDFAIMKAARDEAFGMIGRDPELKEERHRLLRDSFVNRFRGRLDFARTG